MAASLVLAAGSAGATVARVGGAGKEVGGQAGRLTDYQAILGRLARGNAHPL